MDFDLEAVREELEGFQKETSNVSPSLENYLQAVAKTGNILFPWCKLQPLLKRKLELVLSEFTKSCPPENIPSLPNTDAFDFDIIKSNLLNAVDAFSNAPFTVQRLCELIVNPKKHYNRTDKYMRGLEKNLLVVSTVDSSENNSRNQIPIVNGCITNSADVTYSDATTVDNDSSICSPPSNGPVLENFASVFPSATRIAAPSNNIQVPVISDSNNFLPNDCVDDFNYDISDNISVDNNSEIMSNNVANDSAFMRSSVMNDNPSVSSSDSASDNQLTDSALVSNDALNSDSATDNISVTNTDGSSIESNNINSDSVLVNLNEVATSSEDSDASNSDSVEQKDTEPLIAENNATTSDNDVDGSEEDMSYDKCSTSQTEEISQKESEVSNMDFEQDYDVEPSPKRRKLSEDSSENIFVPENENIANEVITNVDDKSETNETLNEITDEESIKCKTENLLNETVESKKNEQDEVISIEENSDSSNKCLNGDSVEINDDDPAKHSVNDMADNPTD